MYLKYGEADVDQLTPDIAVLGDGLRNRISMQLSNLTMEELTAFKKFWELAFELAEPVVTERDRLAAEALERGDDSHPRIFRQKPVFAVRPSRRKVERALEAPIHNQLVDRMEAYKEHILINVNDLKDPYAEADDDFFVGQEYTGEDAADAEINLPIEK